MMDNSGVYRRDGLKYVLVDELIYLAIRTTTRTR